MNRDRKSGGRKKKVTSVKGSVYKRGSGLNSKKPMGNSSGYSSRKESHSSQGSGNVSSSGGSQKTSGTGMSLKSIITIAIIVIVGYFLLKSCMNIDLLDSLGAVPFDDTQSTSNTLSNENLATLDTTVSDDARDKYTQIIGDGEDTITIMIYMCGSDLESRSGMATADLNEMVHANIGDNVNIIVETGGAKTWKNNIISNRTNQRYLATSEGLVLVDDNIGKKSMTDPNTLTDFIEYSMDNYSANRYALILWDHGGGSAQGFGHDEFFPNTTMTLDEIDTALNNANCKFDFVGFDACLMATYETALMLEDYADYLIASEETEPGIGWYYTDWLTALSKNTSMSTLTIGKNIIDSFVEKCYIASPRDKTTLSLIDLAELAGTVPVAFNEFASSTGELINSDEFKIVSDARSGSREFGSPSQLDQIDLIHLAQNIATPEAQGLVEVLNNCIKYNRTSSLMSNSNGLSIYFPYTTLSSMGSMIKTYEKIGMDKAYTDCIRGFANLEVGGQAISSGSSNPLGALLGSFTGNTGGSSVIGDLLTSFVGSGAIGDLLGGSSTDTSWVDTDQMVDNTQYYEDNYISSESMQLKEKDGGYVLSMTDAEWDIIQNVALNIFLDDGEGYIDLGLDNWYEFDDDKDLKIDFDGTWVAINSQVVSYYFISEEREGDDYAIVGRVPAMLNDELVDLILAFTSDNPYGEVLGARLVYDDGSTAKGLVKIARGDVIDFICDYYTYDEEFSDSYFIGDQLIVSGDLDVSYVSVGDVRCMVTYQLTDMYNNMYWTQALEYK